MDRFWGKMLDRIQMLDEQVVWMQFPAEKEAKEVMERATRVEKVLPLSLLWKNGWNARDILHVHAGSK